MISWHVFAAVEEAFIPVSVCERVKGAIMKGEHGGMVEIRECTVGSIYVHALCSKDGGHKGETYEKVEAVFEVHKLDKDKNYREAKFQNIF